MSNESIFPREPRSQMYAGNGSIWSETIDAGSVGLTKRELFAAMAMQGLLSNLVALRRESFADCDIEIFARMRADALLAELAK